MKHWKYWPVLTVLCLIALCGAARAEQAQDITASCRLTTTVNAEHLARVKDGTYDWYWTGTGGSLTIQLPKDKPCQGISISFFKETVPLYITVEMPGGVWRDAAEYTDPFRNAYIPVEAATAVNIRPMDRKAEFKLSRVTVWGEGELPDTVQRWQSWGENEEADLVLFATHPDDELLWFGGLIPYYTAERGKKVLVAYAVGTHSPRRVNELLDGLWTCGVRLYPELGTFADLNGFSEAVVIMHWGKDAAEQWCTDIIRRYRPKVVVTHAEDGESGHKQHKVLSKAVVNAVTKWCGDAEKAPESAAKYGPYRPLKLYLHNYGDKATFLDWTQPLSAFDGVSGAEVAAEAFRKHRSQIRSGYRVQVSGPNDSRYFGLYDSQVGPDESCDDLFEHID